MVFLTKTPCPTSPSHPSVPKGHHGTSRDVPWCPPMQLSVQPVHPIPHFPRDTTEQGMSHGDPQHNSLSHLSITSLSPKGMYGTSRDVVWSSLTQLSVPAVYPQSCFAQYCIVRWSSLSPSSELKIFMRRGTVVPLTTVL